MSGRDGSRDTIVVQLTGNGRGAVATLLVEGTNALETVEQHFTLMSGKRPRFKPNQTYFGRWVADDHDEELVVCRVADTEFEIHCHGGRMSSRQIVSSLVASGVREIEPEMWLALREADPTVRGALEMLPHAKTERVAGILLDQTRGAFRSEVVGIADLIGRDPSSAITRLERLVSLGKLGPRLLQPFSVVLLGPPNAGKSSLVNAIVGYQRAIVFDQPGTTRDLVSVETSVDGWPVEITDTAGIRESDDVIEREGIRRAKQQIEAADLVIQVIDLTSGEGVATPLEVRSLRVGTKCDLDTGSDGDLLRTSSVSGQGISILVEKLASTLVPNPPAPGEAIPLDEQTVDRLITAMRSCEVSDTSKAIELLRSMLARD